MNFDKLRNQINFIHEIDKVKYILRKTKLFNSDRNENDAEHSWHLAIMAIILAEYANEPVDVLKVVKMLLIHDVVKIDAGDVFLYDTVINHTNTDAETEAAKRIFGLLPPEQADDLITIWEEFEAGQTTEAKFARAMDRLEPLLQNISNNGGTWKEFSVSYERVLEKKGVIQHGSEELWAFAEKLINESAEKAFYKRNQNCNFKIIYIIPESTGKTVRCFLVNQYAYGYFVHPDYLIKLMLFKHPVDDNNLFQLTK